MSVSQVNELQVAVQVESPYLVATEAAAYLRTSVQGIYSLVKRGRLKPMPGSGRLLFTREALDECLRRKMKRG
jgi:excisionase family DNA binding protein